LTPDGLEAAEIDDATHVHPDHHRSPIVLEPVTAALVSIPRPRKP
jgi:hypothetical protein